MLASLREILFFERYEHMGCILFFLPGCLFCKRVCARFRDSEMHNLRCCVRT
jgi:hypothetical protein